MKQNVHVWHLEITDPEETREATSARKSNNAEPADYELRQVDTCLPEFNRFLYVAVGAPWRWYMRLEWTYADWQSFLNKSGTETWVAYRMGTPIGYFELEAQESNSAEICYFGLLPDFIGQGYGKKLLEDAIARAWIVSGNRVWLHTCTLDHPQALSNYLARGFRVFKEEDLVDEEVPDTPTQPWPDANKRHM